mmetsp:Transcript_22330/g.47595  ORF Transcript_22330/g.47595 Transcript_22330/m.47595 type:complete len:779 (+) Transcript_22330:216-2552(+)
MAAAAARKGEEDRKRIVALLAQSGNGSFLRGWRKELDMDGSLDVDFPDFVQAAARLNYVGDMQLLFGGDEDCSNLSLDELSKYYGELMDRFKQWVRDEFGSPGKMFTAMDTEGKSKVARENFLSVCRERGFKEDEPGEDEDKKAPKQLEEIYSCIDVSEAGCFTYEEAIFLEVDPKLREDELFKLKVGQTREWKLQMAAEYMERSKLRPPEKFAEVSNKHRMAPRPWQDAMFEALPSVVYQRRYNKEREESKKAKEARARFLEHIYLIYGNEVRAMRQALDSDGSNSISLIELRSYCRKVDLKFNVADLWRGLKRDDGQRVALEELNAWTAMYCAKFRSWVRDRLGHCAALWDAPEVKAARERRNKNSTWSSPKKMRLGTLLQGLKAMGWPDVDDLAAREAVLSALDLYNCGLIEQSDLEWLDKWVAPEWLAAEPDEECWKQLKALFVRTYRHPLKAWRMLLDRDNSNKLSWSEFSDACRKVRFEGDAGAAWRALDKDLSGFIGMREYDPPSAELLESFKDWCETNYGSVTRCFKSLDEDNGGSVSFGELKRACHRMKWHGEVRLLFECIDTDGGDGGKRSISLDEVAFLDQWQIVPPEEEAALMEQAMASMRGRRPSLGGTRVGTAPSTGTAPATGSRPAAAAPVSESAHRTAANGGPGRPANGAGGTWPQAKGAQVRAPSLPSLHGNQRQAGPAVSPQQQQLRKRRPARPARGGAGGLARCDSMPAAMNQDAPSNAPCVVPLPDPQQTPWLPKDYQQGQVFYWFHRHGEDMEAPGV